MPNIFGRRHATLYWLVVLFSGFGQAVQCAILVQEQCIADRPAAHPREPEPEQRGGGGPRGAGDRPDRVLHQRGVGHPAGAG